MVNKYQLLWGNPPEYLTTTYSPDGEVFNRVAGAWTKIPQDEHGLPDPEWLRWVGVPIVASEVFEEKHVSLEGKNIRYTIKYRIDTMPEGTNMFKHSVGRFYGETRGNKGYLVIRG